jgi:thioesterase domain-containing protein
VSEPESPAPPKRDPNLFVLRSLDHDARAPSPALPRPPLFLVGVAGVNALGYVALARSLPAAQPVYVLQPRRWERPFPAEGIGPGGRDEYAIVAAEYLASLRAVQPRGPYFLGGSCDGALVAFAMARLLEAEGERVALLAVLDTWPLENTAIYPLALLKVWRRAWYEMNRTQRRALLRRKAAEAVDRGKGLVLPRGLAGDRASGASVTTAPSASPVPDEAEPTGVVRQALWRARVWPGEGFQPPVVEAPIAVLRVQDQPYWRIQDDALGWRGRTCGVVTVHILPGDHFNWAQRPHVASFARTLAGYLDPAEPATPDRAPAPAPAPIPDHETVPRAWGEVFTVVKRTALEVVELLARES